MDKVLGKKKGTSRSSIEISEELLRRIRSGRYLPGETLSQYSLAMEFNTSRTPIREALRFLEARNAITLTDSGRAKVTVPSTRAIKEAFQIRAELEGLGAKLAVNWINDEDLLVLATHQKNYAETLRSRIRSDSGSDWVKHDTAFHKLINERSHNEQLEKLITELRGSIITNALNFASRMPPRLMEENIKEHEEIIVTLASRNPEAAREVMVAHITNTAAIVIDWMESKN